jgi:L-lactate utilization protein LutB
VGPVGDDIDVGGILKGFWCGVAGREREKSSVMTQYAPDFVHQTNERKHALSVSVDDDARNVLEKVVRRYGIKKIVLERERLTDEVSLQQVHVRRI